MTKETLEQMRDALKNNIQTYMEVCNQYRPKQPLDYQLCETLRTTQIILLDVIAHILSEKP